MNLKVTIGLFTYVFYWSYFPKKEDKEVDPKKKRFVRCTIADSNEKQMGYGNQTLLGSKEEARKASLHKALWVAFPGADKKDIRREFWNVYLNRPRLKTEPKKKEETPAETPQEVTT